MREAEIDKTIVFNKINTNIVVGIVGIQHLRNKGIKGRGMVCLLLLRNTAPVLHCPWEECLY